jgi:hypothetical protein
MGFSGPLNWSDPRLLIILLDSEKGNIGPLHEESNSFQCRAAGRGFVDCIELTHDVLIPVIKASRDTRLTREALADAQRRIQDAKRKDRLRRVQLIFAVAFAFVCLALAGATFLALLQAHKLSDEKKSVLRSASAVKPLFSDMAMLSLEDESNADPVLPESVTQLLSEKIA